jgi:pyruvate kinase
MKTKIIVTVGPASSSAQILKKLIYAGADVFRLNFSHGNHKDFEKIISTIRDINKKLDTKVAILADLQGPKIRVGDINNGQMMIRKGDLLTFTTRMQGKLPEEIFINYPGFPADVKPGENILLDDGKLTLQIVETDKRNKVTAKVIIGGLLLPKKGVNLPDTCISLPSLSEKDIRDIQFLLRQQVEWIGLSFVRTAKDIHELSDYINEQKPEKPPSIIAKIEKPEAVEDIDNIIREADGIMIARGDLGVEVPLQRVPLIQKKIVAGCIEAGKPVIIATQMMEGMMTNSRPTRAEVNDVANSVMDGADALMLSGETSIGSFPVEAVKTMQKIISEVENYEEIYYKQNKPILINNSRFISDSIIYSGVNMAREANAKAIVAIVSSGYSVKKIASHRPRAMIFAFSPDDFVLCKLNLIWGIHPLVYKNFVNTDQTFSDLRNELKSKGLIKVNDLIIHISNMPVNQPGKSNMLKLTVVE